MLRLGLIYFCIFSAISDSFRISKGSLNFDVVSYANKIQNNMHCLSSSTLSEVNDISKQDLCGQLLEVSKQSEELEFEALFRELCQSEVFQNEYWQKKPLYCSKILPNVCNSYTMNDVKAAIDTDFLEAGRGTFQNGRTGWNMAEVSQPRGKSFEEAKLNYNDVQMALRQTNGTVVFNSAGGFISKLAGVCLHALNAFQFPIGLNMYLTNPGQRTSAPPHTDKQDVFVLQTQGLKRWRVFSPTNPKKTPFSDPFSRGKGKDVLDMSELSQPPLIDVVLSPGQLLYVPAGFPHTTDTTTNIDINGEPSVHLTVGVDSIIWGMTYADLRTRILKRNNLPDSIELNHLEPSLFFSLQNIVPLGCFAESSIKPFLQSGYSSNELRNLLFGKIATELIHRMRQVEPHRWTMDDSELIKQLQVEESIKDLVKHHIRMVDIFGRMYTDVAEQLSPAKMNLNFFRSQPYFLELETAYNQYIALTNTVPQQEVIVKDNPKKKGFGK